MFTQERLTHSVIETSWRRVAMTGLCPSAVVDDSDVEEVDRRSRLMVAAGPVLDEMAAELDDTGFAVILADRHAALTDLRYGQKRLASKLEAIGAIEGRIFREEHTGTNSIGTAFELRKGLAVRGGEHYLESLKKFSCYGEPIVHPATQRVEGVLDITYLSEHDNPLLPPFVIRSARQIGERLLDQARDAEKRIFGVFQHATVQARSRPVIAVGDDIFLANAAAMQIIESADQAVLRAVSVDRAQHGETTQQVQLCSGRTVTASINPVAGTGAAVFVLSPPSRAQTPSAPSSRRRSPTWTLICGEPGSGRTTTARQTADPTACWFDAGDILDVGEHNWLRRFSEALGAPSQCVVIEAVDMLPEPLIARVAEHLRAGNARVVFTSCAPGGLQPAHAALVTQSDDTVELTPLRQRRAEIPGLANAVLKDLGVASQVRFTPEALEALAGHNWPGNLHELHAVVVRVARARQVGDITVNDLPEAYRCRLRRRLSPIEQAERDAIVSALRVSSGNKKAAAHALGISRTTLYKAIRAYGILAPTPSA
jgi:sigma-54 dependent transcriptional regulator, acetoin dehydrogenase operon transcriptional activator AcoR